MELLPARQVLTVCSTEQILRRLQASRSNVPAMIRAGPPDGRRAAGVTAAYSTEEAVAEPNTAAS